MPFGRTPGPLVLTTGPTSFAGLARCCRVWESTRSLAQPGDAGCCMFCAGMPCERVRLCVWLSGLMACACVARCCRVQAPVRHLAQPGDAGCLLSCSLFRAARCFRVLGVACLCAVRAAQWHRVLVCTLFCVYFSHLVCLPRFAFSFPPSLSLAIPRSLFLSLSLSLSLSFSHCRAHHGSRCTREA